MSILNTIFPHKSLGRNMRQALSGLSVNSHIQNGHQPNQTLQRNTLSVEELSTRLVAVERELAELQCRTDRVANAVIEVWNNGTH